MKSPNTQSSLLENLLRLAGWTLLIGGLCLSLFADSLTGIGSLATSLRGYGFPAGTLCLAGILSLALGSIRKGHPIDVSPVGSGPKVSPSAKSEDTDKSSLRELEDRLIAELNQRHEDLKTELKDVSSLIEASIEAAPLENRELPMAAGAELMSTRSRRPRLATRETKELEIVVELEEVQPDESRLWRDEGDKLRSGDLEDRLYNDVLVEEEGYIWDFPIKRQRERLDEEPKQMETDSKRDEPQLDDETTIDRKNISWFDWDEEDLV